MFDLNQGVAGLQKVRELAETEGAFLKRRIHASHLQLHARGVLPFLIIRRQQCQRLQGQAGRGFRCHGRLERVGLGGRGSGGIRFARSGTRDDRSRGGLRDLDAGQRWASGM